MTGWTYGLLDARFFIKEDSAVDLGTPDLISKAPASYSIIFEVSSWFQPKAPKSDHAVTAIIGIPSFLRSTQVSQTSFSHRNCSSLVQLRWASVIAIGRSTRAWASFNK